MTDIPGLTSVLTYHVVSGSHNAADVLSHPHLRTIQGTDLNITTVEHKHYVNDAQIVQADMAADNGVLHVIDAVLLPPAPTAP